MFEKATSVVRKIGVNRFTPGLSLLLSAASFALNFLVVLPATKGGSLESLHLLTLNTSNIGRMISFTPTNNTSNFLSRDDVPSLVARHSYEVRHKRSTVITASHTLSSSNITFGNLTAMNVTTTTVTVSLPTPTQVRTALSIETSLGGLVQSFGSGNNTQLGTFLQQILTNITSGVLKNLSKEDGDLGQFFGDIVRNLTAGINEEISEAGEPTLQQVLQELVTGNYSGSLSDRLVKHDFVDNVLRNFSTVIADSVSKAQETAAIGIANALGVQQFYTMHLRQVCSGTLSNISDPNAKFHIFGCFPYRQAAMDLSNLISKIPSSTTVLSTNISIPAIGKVNETFDYVASLANTLSKTIFSFYLLSIFGSGAIIIGSLLGFLFPGSPAIMYSNLAFSILSSLASLAGSATVTAFITTAYNIINIFGSSVGLRAGVGSLFLIITWASFGLTLLTNWYVLAVWFFQFRTIEVRVQRRSPVFLAPPMSPEHLAETVDTSGETVPTMNTFSSRTSFSIRKGSRRQSQYADF